MSKSIITIVIIFGTAFLLAAAGCADSGGESKAPTVPADNNPPATPDDNDNQPNPVADLKPLNPNEVRECSNEEFAQLVSWRNTLDKAVSLIDQAKGLKQAKAVEASQAAVNSCNSRFQYHSESPCKKTKTTVVSSKTTVYDAYLIHKDCKKPREYLNKFPAEAAPVPTPLEPQPTPVPMPTAPDVAGLQMCTKDEFARLSQWSAELDRANKNIAKLGSSWKYDSNAISSAALATKSCEALIKYHTAKPCEKDIKQPDNSTIKRQYTQETLKQRCQTTRQYFYEFVQNEETLIFSNADLYVDFSNFGQTRFEAQSMVSLGSCIVENRTDAAITDVIQLVTETRGFESKMMVLLTDKGLKLECYGLDLDGPFSKTQIERLLKAEGADLRLIYKLK